MSTPSLEKPLLRIGRHAVQAMLHEALASQPGICGGLLAGKGNNIITAAPLANCAADPTHDYACRPAAAGAIISSWHRQDLTTVGCFRSYTEHTGPQLDDFRALQAAAMEAMGESTSFQWYLAIDLDTAGRLEVRAYAASGDDLIEAACELLEDGASRT